ncbi:MAG: NAD(+) diphosphatase [Pseudomonadota bacterium]|nr:NAD(+) diphosphatase [Pseudomonadota bacterium]
MNRYGDGFSGRFEPVLRFETVRADPAWWFVCDGSRLWVRREADGSFSLPRVTRALLLGLATDPVPHPLGYLDGVACQAVGADSNAETTDPQGQWLDLRRLHGRLPQDLFLLAGRAIQIVAWDRTHRYCGQCATALVFAENDRAKQCPACGLRQFPRLAPAVMAMVVRGTEVLLARGPEFPEGMFSILAGFVEPGETLESCVRREVAEEVGIEVGPMRYLGSQPWPFPHSLMIGFVCEYRAGALRPDGVEIVEAGWFDYRALPPHPGPMSLAGVLIADFVADCTQRFGVT